MQASTLFTRVRSMLDDDNSVRYTESADLVPAANSAIDYVTAVFNAAFEQKKLQPIALSELTTVWMIDPTVNSNSAIVNLDDSGEGLFNDLVWTIIGVEPNIPTGAGGAFTYSNQNFATRVPSNEWGFTLKDPFSPGYSGVPADFISYAYTGPGDYFGTGHPTIMIRPGALFTEGESKVGVWVLLKHTSITAGTSEILFPVTVFPLIEQKMIQYLTYQSDDDRLFKITDKEVKELIQLMN